MFEMNNDESQSRPITPPSVTTEQPAQQLSPLLPSIPPHFTPSRPRAPQLVAPVEATSPEELDIIPAMEKLMKMSAQDVWEQITNSENYAITIEYQMEFIV
ncbi:hypothetical protein Clacol_004442 [Clathrus columnatus]|uniref:Uncharacterized protein n=1 Tax=Clathrus columnatus TaxID=1419009 RepID=A0AAV5A6G0_9AGAM|nr:hypothetical protein Clacol_004442 [Clathrus columnatus]